MRVATRIVSPYTHSLKIDIKTAFNRSQVTMIHRMMSDIRHNSARYAETFIAPAGFWPLGFGPEAKTRGGILGFPACIHVSQNVRK